MQSDSVTKWSRRRAEAVALLQAPVTFKSGSVVLDRSARDLVIKKAWFLYLNHGLIVRLRGLADRGLSAYDGTLQGRARVDAVRGLLMRRVVDMNQVEVEEEVSEAGDSKGGAVEFTLTGEVAVLDTPPPDAALPAPERVAGLVGPPGGRRYRWGAVRIFYATDRARSSATDFEHFYGSERAAGGDLEFGRIEVTIPRLHRPGVVERPAWYQIDRTTNPDRHVMIRMLKTLPEGVALDSMRKAVAGSGLKEALVFIHGYNVTFHDAALRTAQLTYDLGFDGAPILYSWPSRGSLFHYSADREASEWSAAHLRRFLDSILAVTGARRLHVIAHSMGNRALTLALQRPPVPADTLFSNLIMAAPDVDATLFEEQIAAAIRPLTQRLTVYMSSKDKALWASRWLSTHRRLGEATSPMLIVKSTDTIDASELDTDLLGHGYFASNWQVIDDLVLLVGQKVSPPRPLLREANFNGQTYWRLP